ncbi:hypothetical protein GCM10010977_28950 [Citricoccus zhacaiensis]|uniref:Uncharacterized protein n=1 Tax=Citricoccus zhacaiensis TaxID=489142 RepID=A0ABQ2MAK3_9MICC|nr:hypothetical protein [Citricoccus zhacaiensis]GGO48717.1 hypothetical protein GCM10010977_28950 [Citricoccus zhacaiensis]
MTENITESFIDQARKLNDQRLAAAQDIAVAVQARVDAEQALKDAQAAERKAFKDAERKGWTKPELDKLRPAKRRRTTTSSTSGDQGTKTATPQPSDQPQSTD